MRNTKLNLLTLVLIFISVSSLACSDESIGNDSSTKESFTIILRGSGASFPKPIYEKWVNEYEKVNAKVKIDYQSKGSGGGQKDILAKLVDFGASDDPMKDNDLSKADGDILHIPTVLGAVALTYNLVVDKPLKLTPEVIAGIYMGKIKKWDDEKIKTENRDVKLPSTDIIPVYRADSSGTTAVLTDFLSNTVPLFKEEIGASKQPNWVKGVGIGAPRNDGVMGQVKQIPNTIGYVEITFAKANKLPIALIKNKTGNFVEATIDSISAAAISSIEKMPDDMRIQITNADGKQTYPISSYTYVLIYKNQSDKFKGKALLDFLWWAIHDGKRFAKDLHYAPLPDEIVKKVEVKLNSVSSNGAPLRKSRGK